MLRAITTKILIILASIFGFALPSYIQNPETPKTEEIVSTSTIEIVKATSTKTISQETQTKETKKTTAIKTTPITTPTVQTQTQQTTIPKIQTPVDYEALNTTVRKSVVNIFCTTQSGGVLYPITGSGVVIGGNGVILTNAHIGQYFLLKDFNGTKDFVQCVVRTGNPAYPTYKAELIYISPTWIENNKTLLTEQNPQGTGEHDYALLRITEKIDKSELGQIPFLPVSLDEGNVTGNVSLLASYPAGFLGGQTISRDLYQSSSITTITKVYTFATSTIDVISVGGTVVSQKGSSGGAVVNSRGELVGIISTSSDGSQTSDRDLRAITLSYINRDLKNESGSSLVDVLSYPAEYAKNFNEKIAPKLVETLTNAILKK